MQGNNLGSGISQSSIKKNNRRGTLNLNNIKIDEQDEHNGDDEGKETNMSERDKAEYKDNVLELRDQDSGNVIHKKRRRKNVESRDAYTQTDRSDYMLIK